MNLIINEARRFTTTSLLRRLLATSSSKLTSQKSPLYLLRQRTGMAYNLCREALNKHNNDLEQAELWLKAQELAHGLQKATKVKGRTTLEGLIGLAVNYDNRSVTIVEINCETDFVAKNQSFRRFAVDLTHQIASSLKESHSSEIQENIKLMTPSSDCLQKVEEQVALMISKLGENIKITRAIHYLSNDEKTFITGQVHAKAAQETRDKLNVVTGRYGAIVALKSQQRHPIEQQLLDRIRMAGERLCQHVIGYSPSYIELPDNLRKQLEDIEREDKHRIEESSNTEEDLYSDAEDGVVARNPRDEWPSMMDQTLIMTDDTIVRDFCRDMHVDIVSFRRFECGSDV